MQLTRADRSVVSEWWFTVDRLLICAVFCLMVGGLLLSLSASPAVALKKGLPAFYFFNRQLVWAAIGAVLLFGLSLMSPARVRRFSSGALLVMLAVLVYVHFAGTEINGAQRWLNVMGLSFQPSEFVKPVYVVVLAWLFAEAQRRPDMPALLLAVILGGGFAGLLVLQPDIGQALLVSFVWGALYVLSGQPLIG
ncbi:MAG: FtsW/RodA/SpoVE family cell cycle protein, partial [Pseudomonadota bacterium]